MKTSENRWKPLIWKPLIWKPLKTSENLWVNLKENQKTLPLRDPLRGRFASKRLTVLLPPSCCPLNSLRHFVRVLQKGSPERGRFCFIVPIGFCSLSLVHLRVCISFMYSSFSYLAWSIAAEWTTHVYAYTEYFGNIHTYISSVWTFFRVFFVIWSCVVDCCRIDHTSTLTRFYLFNSRLIAVFHVMVKAKM